MGALNRGRQRADVVLILLVFLVILELFLLYKYSSQQPESVVVQAESMSRSKAAELLPQAVVLKGKGQISGSVELPQKLLREHDLYVALYAKASPVEPGLESYNVSYLLLNSSASRILNNPWEEGEISIQVATVENGSRKESFEKWPYGKAVSILRNVSLGNMPRLPPASMAVATNISSFSDVGFDVEYRKYDETEKWPVASLYAGNRYLGSVRVDSERYANYLLVVPAKDLRPGRFNMVLRFDNPYRSRSGETRKLYVDKIIISGVT